MEVWGLMRLAFSAARVALSKSGLNKIAMRSFAGEGKRGGCLENDGLNTTAMQTAMQTLLGCPPLPSLYATRSAVPIRSGQGMRCPPPYPPHPTPPPLPPLLYQESAAPTQSGQGTRWRSPRSQHETHRCGGSVGTKRVLKFISTLASKFVPLCTPAGCAHLHR